MYIFKVQDFLYNKVKFLHVAAFAGLYNYFFLANINFDKKASAVNYGFLPFLPC